MMLLIWLSLTGVLGVRFVVLCFSKFVVSALVETADSTKDCSYIESAKPLI